MGFVTFMSGMNLVFCNVGFAGINIGNYTIFVNKLYQLTRSFTILLILISLISSKGNSQSRLPSLELATFTSDTVSLESIYNNYEKIIILTWATWALPSKNFLFDLAKKSIEIKNSENYAVFLISIDETKYQQKAIDIKNEIQTDYSFSNWYFFSDPQRIYLNSLGIGSVPYCALIDKNGIIIDDHVGWILGDTDYWFNLLKN